MWLFIRIFLTVLSYFLVFAGIALEAIGIVALGAFMAGSATTKLTLELLEKKGQKMKQLVLASLIILLISLAACGKPEEEPVHEEAAVDLVETLVAHQALLKRNEELEVIFQRLQGKQAEYVTAIKTLSDENLALRTALALNQSLGGSRQKELETALNELITLREEKLEWGRLAEREYEQLLENYNKLAALYPPTHFISEKELIEWRANTGNVTELGCLGLQKLALAGGYIVSAHPNLGYCVAIAGDYWYRIIPGDQDLVEKIRKVE